jgi:tetratricopeptide (TPR) repeat protein
MHSFLWTGKDPSGNERSERVEAENAQAAKAILTQRGWTNLQMITDEICDIAQQGMPKEWETPDETADVETQRWKGKQPSSFLPQWGATLWESKGALVICALFLGYGIYRNRLWSIILGGGGLVALALLFPAISIFFSQTMRNYSRLNKAKVWGRWNEVLDCVERLRHSHRLTRIGVGETELVRNRALALAHLERLDDALKEMKQLERLATLPHWTYCSHLAGIYEAARQHEKALELRRQIAMEKPDSAAVWIDVSYGFVRYLNRPAEAREALAKAETHENTGLGLAYVPFVRGMILWREGKHTEAKEQFEEALAGFQPMAHHELVEGLLLLCKSYLCAIHRALGQFDEAKKLWRETGKFMTVNREDELLAACRAGTLGRTS